MPATLAQHAGPASDHQPRLRSGRANSAWRAGLHRPPMRCVLVTVGVLGCVARRHPPWAPSCGGGMSELDRVSRQLLHGPLGPDPATCCLDLDSTICETLYPTGQRRGATPQLTGARGYHPCWPSPPARRADVPAAEGRGFTARGAAHSRKCCYGRPLCAPTAASTPTLSSPSAARWVSASPSPSARGLRELI